MVIPYSRIETYLNPEFLEELVPRKFSKFGHQNICDFLTKTAKEGS